MKTVTGATARSSLDAGVIDLTWQNPPASDFAGGPPLAGIRIERRERSYPLQPGEGDCVYDGDVVSAFSDRGLRPLTTYYYTIFASDQANPGGCGNVNASGYYMGPGSSASAFATMDYGLAERLYRLLPAVHQRYDAPLGPLEIAQLSAENAAAAEAFESLPADLRSKGQLWRFFRASVASLDLMRSFAEGLPFLHDAALARPEFLPLLAQWLGWVPDTTMPVFSQRTEIHLAPPLFRTVGTVGNLRQIVNRYTGWIAQVAEFAQTIACSNQPPRLNVHAIAEQADGWWGTDDAAAVLGFGTAASDANGAPGLPAELAGTAVEPYALRPGMELTVVADQRIPVVTRFRAGDFADIAAATAAEVAAVLNQTLSEITTLTTDPPSKLVLRSHTTGTGSSVQVQKQDSSLVTLEGAPAGRLSVFTDTSDPTRNRMRLFYETAVVAAAAAAATPAGTLGAEPCGQIRYKTFRGGQWGTSVPLLPPGAAPHGSPAAVEVGPNALAWIAWIQQPGTGSSTIRYMTGIPRVPSPATLTGQRSETFSIPPGSYLLFNGNWRAQDGFRFSPGDFADPQHATAQEVAAALNTRMAHVQADVLPNGTISLVTDASGGEEFLSIDRAASTAADALGFGPDNSTAQGDWGDVIDWSRAQDATTAARHADLFALPDGAGVRLFWARFDEAEYVSEWQIVSSRWDQSAGTWSAVEILAQGPFPGGAPGPSSSREPFALVDKTGRTWLFWSRQDPTAPGARAWALRQMVFDPAAGTWGAEEAVTSSTDTSPAADREPAACLLDSGDIRVYFCSDRAGGMDLWSVDVPASGGTPGTPVPVSAGPAWSTAPVPTPGADGTRWLLHRSDRSISLSGVSTRPLPLVQDRVTSSPVPADVPVSGALDSIRAPDAGTARRFAGTTSVLLGNAARIGEMREWGDLVTYTPQKPKGPPVEPPLQDNEVYSRGTIGLYLSQIIPDSSLARQMEQRLRPVLTGFLPVNTRVVVLLAPRLDIEYVYSPGADIGESYQDQYPYVDYFPGVGETAAADLPDWSLLHSNTLTDVSADPSHLTTLRRRTFYPPPQ